AHARHCRQTGPRARPSASMPPSARTGRKTRGHSSGERTGLDAAAGGRNFGDVSTFEGGALVQFQRDHVFRANRDMLAEAMRHVDDVEVVVRSRSESDGRVEMVNVWQATPVIPASVASVVKPHMLVWQDRAVWTLADYTCRWSVE